MSLTDLKSYLHGLSMYKRVNADVRDVVKEEIKEKKANKGKAPTTAEKFNSKYSERQTGGQRWGSFFFALLG